jgi:hypothetical protein
MKYDVVVEKAAKRIDYEAALRVSTYVGLSAAADVLARIEADARLVRHALIREMNRLR